VRVMFH